jgi:plastocyanin
MRLREVFLFSATVLVAASACAQDITGTILIKKRLTKPSVTAPVSVYQRGTTVKLGKDGGEDPIAYERSRVVVYLEGPLPALNNTPATTPFQIQQIDRRFLPDLLVVPVGSTISFPNMDPIFHNIYSLSKPKSFDLGSYDTGDTRNVLFSKPGIVEIYCHLHPNMAATVVVTPNRWYARPDPSGQFRIPNVPPGQYTIIAWHKSAGFFRQSLLVDQGHDSSVEFFIPLDLEPKQEAHKEGATAGSAGSR